jgi:potassium efflux system protein
VAALSVGIGFGLQEIVANFICGLILLFEQPIRVGDTVTVGETSGVVTRIRMRATTIRDWDRRELLVPNKEFITGRLLNWSLSDQLTRFDIVVGVAYGTNLKKAMELAIEAAQEHPDVLDDPAPFITFDEFGDNSLQLVLRCFMGSVDKRLTTSSQIRLAVNNKFNQAGIVIAFPQQDVHLDTSVPLEINVRSSLNPSP